MKITQRPATSKALKLAEFVFACLVLFVFVPEVLMFGSGLAVNMWANSASHIATIEAHRKSEEDARHAALPTCEDYHKLHKLVDDVPLPPGDWKAVNERGDWLCR